MFCLRRVGFRLLDAVLVQLVKSFAHAAKWGKQVKNAWSNHLIEHFNQLDRAFNARFAPEMFGHVDGFFVTHHVAEEKKTSLPRMW